MKRYALVTVSDNGKSRACLDVDGVYFPVSDACSRFGGEPLPDTVIGLLADWEKNKIRLAELAQKCGLMSTGLDPRSVLVETPIQFPGKVLCAGANYYDHIAEMGVKDLRKEAQRLFFFFKPPRNAIVGPGRTVIYPAESMMFDWEIELAVVIGKRAKRLTLENALDSVAAYSVAIDLSARDMNQAPDTFYKLDWVAGKGQDTCCPLGPRLVPAEFIADPQNLGLELSVNGEVKQQARTSGMIFDIREQLVILSRLMTLDPGDVILTGTPAGVGFPKRTFLKAGDRIDAEIESIGRLTVEIMSA